MSLPRAHARMFSRRTTVSLELPLRTYIVSALMHLPTELFLSSWIGACSLPERQLSLPPSVLGSKVPPACLLPHDLAMRVRTTHRAVPRGSHVHVLWPVSTDMRSLSSGDKETRPRVLSASNSWGCRGCYGRLSTVTLDSEEDFRCRWDGSDCRYCLPSGVSSNWIRPWLTS
ncbi:hypothetical protein BC629DRAFT_1001805 [Irpex lacteus]|nr:hypothetical protein BC629DRAFT_1001805 [Irpex lacteus]